MADDSTMKKVDKMIEEQGISPDGVSKEDKKLLAEDIEAE